MRIKNLEELRKIQMEIKHRRETNSSEEVREQESVLLAAVRMVMELNKIARREGLLALEEAVIDIRIDTQEEVLKQLLLLVLDGTEPEVIAGIGLTRYYVNLYNDYKALIHFIYLEGVLSIQAGDNPHILEEKLKGMLPLHMYQNYSVEQKKKELEEEKQKGAQVIANLCQGERFWNPGESGYYLSRLVDYVVCDISDKEMQRVLREIDNMVLSLAMKGMSGTARKRIFTNLSERLGNMIAEDMVNMGPVRVTDILESSQKILSVVIRLIDNGELIGKYEYLQPFYNVVCVDTKVLEQKRTQVNELKKMVEEYEVSARLLDEISGM